MNWNYLIKLFSILFASFIAFILVFAGIMYATFDENNFNYNPKTKFTDFCYFLVVTISGTGYGDITPKTTGAKMLVSFIILLFYLSLFTLSVASLLYIPPSGYDKIV